MAKYIPIAREAFGSRHSLAELARDPAKRREEHERQSHNKAVVLNNMAACGKAAWQIKEVADYSADVVDNLCAINGETYFEAVRHKS